LQESYKLNDHRKEHARREQECESTNVLEVSTMTEQREAEHHKQEVDGE